MVTPLRGFQNFVVKDMKIVTTTEVSLTLEDLEKMIREKGIIPDDLKLENVINVPNPKGLRLVFTKSTETVNLLLNTEISKEDKEKFLDTPFVDIDLSVRSLNCLKASDIQTPRDLTKYTVADFARFRNFGRKSLKEIEDLMAKHGITYAAE